MDAEEQEEEVTNYADHVGWWMDTSIDFHLLSMLARCLLAIPLTKVHLDRTFPSARLLFMKTRNRLDRNSVDAQSLVDIDRRLEDVERCQDA